MEASVNPRVRFIAPKIGRAAPTVQKTEKRKVAGYARVSTDMEEQQTSYAAQVDYYTNFIKAHPDWEFVRVYTDEERSYPALYKNIGEDGISSPHFWSYL